MKLSESKTNKGAFTYYVIAKGGRRVSKCLFMIMGEGEGSWPCDDINKKFLFILM